MQREDRAVGATARYRITVSGRLSERFARAFDGMAIEPADGATALVGELADQSQLYGLLERIRDLSLDLVSVEREEAS